MSEHGHNHDCECGCGHNHDEETEMTVTLTLEDGSEVECDILTIFDVEDQQYIALLPISEEEDDAEDAGEVFLYRFKELENGELELLNIEDDEEYEKVADAFDELLDTEEFEDMIEDEDEE